MKKASARVDTRVMMKNPDKEQSETNNAVARAANPDKYQLPIEQIKKDVGKNFMFAAFAVALVVGLKVTGFGFEQIKHLLNL